MANETTRKRTRTRTPAAVQTAADTQSLVPENTVTEVEQPAFDLASKAPRSNESVGMPRISFDRGSQDPVQGETTVRSRSRTSGQFEPRGYTEQVSSIRERIQPPMRPGDLPIAVIDEYGFVLPFSANNPMDRVILSQIPGITFVYTESDYQMVKEHNAKMIREQRFEDTLQGAKLRMPPTQERHGFRNGREVVASFVDETQMHNQDYAEQRFNQYSN